MANDYSPAQLAEGVIRRGIARLAAAYPFHACLLQQFRLVPAPEVNTMGVTAARDEVLLLFAPEFILSLPADQLGGALLHETHHVALGHLLLDPADYEDRWALTTATELSVNEFITEPLPPVAST
jgi:predicted metal-dependent peptidase